jgi:hypothetical protein
MHRRLLAHERIDEYRRITVKARGALGIGQRPSWAILPDLAASPVAGPPFITGQLAAGSKSVPFSGAVWLNWCVYAETTASWRRKSTSPNDIIPLSFSSTSVMPRRAGLRGAAICDLGGIQGRRSWVLHLPACYTLAVETLWSDTRCNGLMLFCDRCCRAWVLDPTCRNKSC